MFVMMVYITKSFTLIYNHALAKKGSTWKEGGSAPRLNCVKGLRKYCFGASRSNMSIRVSCVKNGNYFYPNLNMWVYIPQ